MDPLTAALNATAAFFNWACTPVGQRILGDVATASEKVAQDITGLLTQTRTLTSAVQTVPTTQSEKK